MPAMVPLISSPLTVRVPVTPAGTVISTWLPVTYPSVRPLGSSDLPVTRTFPENREPDCLTSIWIWPAPSPSTRPTQSPCHLPLTSTVGGAWVVAQPACPSSTTPTTSHRNRLSVSLSPWPASRLPSWTSPEYGSGDPRPSPVVSCWPPYSPSPQLRVHDPVFSLESGAQRTTLGTRANHVKASFRRARCGFSRSRRAGHALLLSVFEPLEAVDGWSVIYSIHDCRTASDRAFFRGVDVCG